MLIPWLKSGIFASIGALSTAAAAIPAQLAQDQRPLEPSVGVAEITVLTSDSASPGPFRMHLTGPDGEPVQPPGLPFWHDHFSSDKGVSLRLPPGEYRYTVERGPEFESIGGQFLVQENQAAEIALRLNRLADMKSEGYWGGDLHIHRPADIVPLLMKVEDLHAGPVITWWNNRNPWRGQPLPREPLQRFDGSRFTRVLAGEDERQGGALLFFNLAQPIDITGSTREHPSPMEFVQAALQQSGAWIDIEKPFWWDVPVWLASGKIDSIGIANNHMQRGRMLPNEAWGRPRDTQRLPPPRGNGFWTQDIYYHALNCGIRLPPTAGSASGVLQNPVGYNRVYVHTGSELSYESWWKNLRQGRCFVSNGPLLRCQADGFLPGHVFRSENALSIPLKGRVTSREPLDIIQIIKNGAVDGEIPVTAQNVDLDLGTVDFKESGWFLIRTIVPREDTFQFASTAPFHVEIGANPRRVDSNSARFFLEWAKERRAQIQLPNPEQQRAVIQWHDQAVAFWEEKVRQGN